MNKKLVYDLPTRIFHWLFAGLFLFAFIIGKTIDDESPTYAFHMLAGLTIGFLVFLRIIWGFLGTRYALFSNFALNPKDLISYFKGFLTNEKIKWPGHNPASSWAGIMMLVLAIGMVTTGFFMTSGGDKDAIKEVHELIANSFIVVALAHVAGLIIHTIRHRDPIGLSMVHGHKQELASSDESINSPRPIVALILLGLVFIFSLYLWNNFDRQTQKLNLFGFSLQLGENETADHNENDVD